MPDLLPQDLLRGCPETWLQPQAEKRCKRGNYNEFNYLDQALSIPDFFSYQYRPTPNAIGKMKTKKKIKKTK
jgi:hypothetical protein